jgi:hypothetical protein
MNSGSVGRNWSYEFPEINSAILSPCTHVLPCDIVRDQPRLQVCYIKLAKALYTEVYHCIIFSHDIVLGILFLIPRTFTLSAKQRDFCKRPAGILPGTQEYAPFTIWGNCPGGNVRWSQELARNAQCNRNHWIQVILGLFMLLSRLFPVATWLLEIRGFLGGFHQQVSRTPKFSRKPIKVFHRAWKTRNVFWKPKRVFGEKPFPKVFHKTLTVFHSYENPFRVFRVF